MILGRCLICGDVAYSTTLEDANRAWNQHYLHHHYQPLNGRRYGPAEGDDQ